MSPRVAPPADVSAPLLSVRGLTKTYGGVAAVDDVTCDVRRGEILGVIGPNGAGKTTLFNLMSGFAAPDSGSVMWDGRDVTSMSAAARARLGLVRTFQQPRTFASLTVRDNLTTATRQRQGRGGRRGADIDVDALIDFFELREVADTKATELSYGYSKILGLALAVATSPDLVLLDEPAAGLSHGDLLLLRGSIEKLRDAGCTICLVEHHMDLVMSICDRVVVLDAGRVLVIDSPDEVGRHPEVISAYLGGQHG